MTALVFIILTVLSPLAAATNAPDTPDIPPPSAQAVEPAPTTRKSFEAGVLGQFALPGQYSHLGTATQNGTGLGWGFLLGYRASPLWAVRAHYDRLFHLADEPGTSNQEYATSSTATLSLKIYPLGEAGPRFYGLVGIGYQLFGIRDGLKFLPEIEPGPNYSGLRYSLGFGYEHPLEKIFALFMEFDATYQTLSRVGINRFPNTALPTNASRWNPTLRLGALGFF